MHTVRLESTAPDTDPFRGFAVQARRSTPAFDENAAFEGDFINAAGLWDLWACNRVGGYVFV